MLHISYVWFSFLSIILFCSKNICVDYQTKQKGERRDSACNPVRKRSYHDDGNSRGAGSHPQILAGAFPARVEEQNKYFGSTAGRIFCSILLE
jgi:hypothetical protein